MSNYQSKKEDCSLKSLFPRLFIDKNLADRDESSFNKITVMGHRGGFKPDNSMESF